MRRALVLVLGLLLLVAAMPATAVEDRQGVVTGAGRWHGPDIPEGGITVAFTASNLDPCPDCDPPVAPVRGTFVLDDQRELPSEQRTALVTCMALTHHAEAFFGLSEVRGNLVFTHAAYARDVEVGVEPHDLFNLIENVSFDCRDSEIRDGLRLTASPIDGQVVVLDPCDLPGVLCPDD